MANYLQFGSSGSRVRQIQEALNKQGYNLAVDGIYGAATKKAVQQYQKKNKLGVDGIVGDETWNSLFGAATDTPSTGTTNETTNGTTVGGDTTTTPTTPQLTPMQQFQQSGYYQSLGLDKLQQQLAGYATDDATLRAQAEALYKPTYLTELEALRQQFALQQQAYKSQLEGMGMTYDRQRRATNQAYDESAVDLNNALTKRGLGRSSLVSTQGAYLESKRNTALSDIDASEAAARNALLEKIALLADQSAQSEKLLASNYAQQLEARIQELRQQNQSAATSLQLQLAQLQQQGYQAYQQQLMAEREQQLAEDQFEYTKTQKSSSGTGSKSSSSGSSSYLPPAADNPADAGSDALLDKLLGDKANNAAESFAGSVGSVAVGFLSSLRDKLNAPSKTPVTDTLTGAKKTSYGKVVPDVLNKYKG